jgi:small subunit ribosomal protein S3
VGQKVNPRGLRLGIVQDWDAKWYADRDFGELLHEDIKLREHIKSKCYDSGVSRVIIERAANRIKITIYTARPGMVIGRNGVEVENLRKELQELVGDKKILIYIEEVKTPELDAQLVAENIAQQLERRVAFRRAMRQAVQRSMRLGAGGIKVKISGRLGGAEMSRSEEYREGKIPLHTLRADIDYGFTEANTMYGTIGVKVWIYKGEVLPPTRRVQEGVE